MRVVIPQITWHSRDPVLSVDFDPSQKGEDFYRVATGGGDCQLLIWRLTLADTFKPDLTCVAELKRHEKPLNVVRFSPDGSYIATGGDDAYIILWKCGEVSEKEENWQFEKSLRKHIEDVSDLSWSPDGLFLLSGSIDNSAVYWDVKKGVALHVWSEKEHTGFVHGVAYDPLHEFAATMCIDRNLRLFDLKTKKTMYKAMKYPDDWISTEIKDTLEVEEKENNSSISAEVCNTDAAEGPANKKSAVVNRLFHDEFLQTFCRRLCFSPRGELLLVPGGLLPPGQSTSGSLNMNDKVDSEDKSSDEDGDKKQKDKKTKKKTSSNNNSIVVFCRHSWTNPCAVIPTLDSYAIATRFCPIYFRKSREAVSFGVVHPKKNERSFSCTGKIAAQKEETRSLMRMPYRLVYAVATNDTVLIGDTASSLPLAVIRSIHLARISDITWAANGQALMVSSTDGYCSIITFDKEELGQEFSEELENFPPLTRDCFPILPLEPKPERQPKKKTAKVKPADGKTGKDKDAANVNGAKLVTPAKKKPVQSKKTKTIIAAATASCSSAQNNESSSLGTDEPLKEALSANRAPNDNGQQKDNNASSLSEVVTPKAAKKRTLDTWIKKTPKSSMDSSMNADASTTGNNSKDNEALCTVKNTVENTPEIEIIELEDEDGQSEETGLNMSTSGNSSAPISLSKSTVKYPMTPPLSAKPIAVRRISTIVSPLVTPPNIGQKRKQGELTPEELHRLKTSPIKLRRLMEPSKPIMESSASLKTDKVITVEERDLENSTVKSQDSVSTVQPVAPTSSVVTEVASSPKVTDPNCPPSPVSSSSSTRPPRRITLTTLSQTKSSNVGKLD